MSEQMEKDFAAWIERKIPGVRKDFPAHVLFSKEWDGWQAALATQPQAPQGAVTGWQPISSAPKDGSTVIIGSADCGTGEGFWNDGSECYGHRGGAGWFWECDRNGLLTASNTYPTHWQPLLAAPKTETPEGEKQ